MGDTVTKIVSILAQAAGDATFDEVQLSESKKIDEATKAVKKVLDEAHAGTKIYLVARPLHKALSNYCRVEAIRLLCDFLRRYEIFINTTSSFTGRSVIYAPDPYADRSDEQIQLDIKFTILVVYCASIGEEGLKRAARKAFEGVFETWKNRSS